MSDPLDNIEKLIVFMEKHGLAELQVKHGELEFKARRGERREPPLIFQAAPGIIHAVPEQSAPGPAATSGLNPALPKGPSKAQKEICSPLVGTFYRRPNPNSPLYKDVGDRVEKNDVVCIVEAMKVMNEIKAEVGGIIKRVLVDDSSPVEFGQPLFLVELD